MKLLGLPNQLGQVGHRVISHIGACLDTERCGQVRAVSSAHSSPTPRQPHLTVVSTCRMVSMCHRLLGANLGGRDSSASLPRPHPLTPRHLSSHLSAANRMPEAQSARRSGGQDSRKACSSRIMARTLELFTRARLSSRARLAGERRPGRWPRLPCSSSTDLKHLVL